MTLPSSEVIGELVCGWVGEFLGGYALVGMCKWVRCWSAVV